MTGEAVDILAFGEVLDVGENESPAVDTVAHLEVEASPFVGQWQGKTASFMRSNKHRDREAERKWDTTGLQGLAMKLVEDDQNARNWWRKLNNEGSYTDSQIDEMRNEWTEFTNRFLKQ